MCDWKRYNRKSCDLLNSCDFMKGCIRWIDLLKWCMWCIISWRVHVMHWIHERMHMMYLCVEKCCWPCVDCVDHVLTVLTPWQLTVLTVLTVDPLCRLWTVLTVDCWLCWPLNSWLLTWPTIDRWPSQMLTKSNIDLWPVKCWRW